jgi:hypothetical protein
MRCRSISWIACAPSQRQTRTMAKDMSFIRGEDDAIRGFRLEAERLIEETRVLWHTFVSTRPLRIVETPSRLPAFEGAVQNTPVSVSAVGSVDLGFHTRALADAKIPLRGSVQVGPPGDWDELVSQLVHRHFFEDPELDRWLVVRTSSKGLAHVVLDQRVLQTVRSLAPGRLELSYEDGAISLTWAGAERNFAILDDVIDVLVYLAVQGGELSPYR